MHFSEQDPVKRKWDSYIISDIWTSLIGLFKCMLKLETPAHDECFWSSIDATKSSCIGRFINHSRRNANIKAQTWSDSPGICFRAIKVREILSILDRQYFTTLNDNFVCRIFRVALSYFTITALEIKRHFPCTRG